MLWKRCKRCGEDLPMTEYRSLRLQYTGVCKVCEAEDEVKREVYARERRFEWMERQELTTTHGYKLARRREGFRVTGGGA